MRIFLNRFLLSLCNIGYRIHHNLSILALLAQFLYPASPAPPMPLQDKHSRAYSVNKLHCEHIPAMIKETISGAYRASHGVSPFSRCLKVWLCNHPNSYIHYYSLMCRPLLILYFTRSDHVNSINPFLFLYLEYSFFSYSFSGLLAQM